MNKKEIFSFLLLSLVAVALVSPMVASADGATVGGIISSIKASLTGLGGSLATIAFIVAGIMYLTGSGNPSRMTVAKGALVAAVIGIVIVLLAGNACEFVNTFTGAGGSC